MSAIHNWDASSAAPAMQNATLVLQVLQLARKARQTKCCTRHAKRTWSAPSAAPARQNEAAPKSITRRRTSADLYECHAKRAWGAPSAAPATQNEPEVLQVLRLPRKKRRRPKASLVARDRRSLWRCSKCCASHAKRAWSAPSAASATQNEAAPKSITRRQTSADLYEGAPSAAPATQNEPEVLQVLRLPRKTSLRCSKYCDCHAKRGGAQSNQLSPHFRGPLWRCSQCCACHAKRAWGGPKRITQGARRNSHTPPTLTHHLGYLQTHHLGHPCDSCYSFQRIWLVGWLLRWDGIILSLSK